MKHFLRKTLSLLLTLSLAASLAMPAAASDALGSDLTSQDTLLNEQTQLSTNVFWSSTYSDLRTENLITYTPNKDVTPIVTFGSVLTDKTKVSAMAKTLEEQGYRVVAGINGDFYNTGNRHRCDGRPASQQRRGLLRRGIPQGRHRRAGQARRQGHR